MEWFCEASSLWLSPPPLLSSHITPLLMDRRPTEAQLSALPRFPLSSPKCLKHYQRLGVFIKEVNFKGFHLCRPPPASCSSFNLAGLWQSKVNKCEMGHVFSILSLCHTCSPLSMINIPPTPGPASLAMCGARAGRPAKTHPGHLGLQRVQSLHFLSI